MADPPDHLSSGRLMAGEAGRYANEDDTDLLYANEPVLALRYNAIVGFPNGSLRPISELLSAH